MASKPSSTQPLVSPTPSASPGANTTTPASSSKNAASSSSSSIDLSNLCHLTISQLQADGNKLTAPCFLCGLLVHHHVTSASSSSHSPSSSKSLDKTVKADMPLWKTDFKVCAPFFKRIEQVFNIHSIHDDVLRRKYLYVTLSDLDAFDVQYVYDNIIQSSLSWDDVKLAFIKRFEQFDHVARLQRDFNNIRYESKDTVQSFSHRFINYCTNLGYDVDAQMTRDRFFLSLPPHVYKRFLVQCHARSVDVASFASLSLIIDELTKLEVIHSTSSSTTTPSSSTSSFDKTKSSSPALHCKWHPLSTTHSTSQCRSHGSSDAAKKVSFASGSSSPVRPNQDKAASPAMSNVTCYACGQKGHLANHPSCPKKASSPSTSNTQSRIPTYRGSPSPSTTASTGMQLRTPLERAPSAAHLLSSSSSSSIKTVDTVNENDSSPMSTSERYLSAIDRCLPPEVLTLEASSTFTAPLTLTLVIADTKYLGLVDTGACSSCVDPLIPVTYGLSVTPVKGKVRMADVNVVSSRIGTCSIQATIVRDDNTAVTCTHLFEVLPLFDRNKGYHFIIGRDILYPLFHHGMSASYFMPDSHVSLPSFDDPLLADIVDTIRAPVSHDSSRFIGLSTLIIDDGSLDITVSETVAASISEDLEMLESLVHDTGAGDTPPDEHPVRPSLVSSSSSSSSTDLFDLDSTTPDDVRREYSDKLSHLRKLLTLNETIAGFCTLPDSQVQLVVDESKLHLLYRRQYPIAHQLWALADKVILRWFDTGKITHAPVGCPYNLPLTIAPKKDDAGGLTGIRVCLDTRVLNSILINTDRFQIPNIRDTLEMFANCELFGEFDLSEAYL